MISLPPGCTVAYGITIDVDNLNEEMIEWFKLIDGTIAKKEHYNYRGQQLTKTYVAYNGGKSCHYLQDGSSHVRLHFRGVDASTASVFILKFNDHIVQHNLKRMEDNVY